MKDMIAKCGYICGRCFSFKENLVTDEDRQRCSDAWHKYFGFRLDPAKLLRCDGCLAPDDEKPVRYIRCDVRACALQNGVENCAYCSEFPCEDVEAKSRGHYRERVEERIGHPISDEEHLKFVKPYEGVRNLQEIRASLSPKDIAEPKRFSVKAKLVEFPSDLHKPETERQALEALHRLLGSVGAAEGVPYARSQALKKRRRNLLKMLWAFGLEGKVKEKGEPYVMLDSETYLSQRMQSNFSTLKSYFEALKEHGIVCDHVPLEEEGWLTPTGALRKGGWFVEMSLDKKAGGAAALRGLAIYAKKLDRKYGKSAFMYFAKADMRVLSDR